MGTQWERVNPAAAGVSAKGRWFGCVLQAPGKTVRMLHAYDITCTEVKKGPDGRPAELLCTFDQVTGPIAIDGSL